MTPAEFPVADQGSDDLPRTLRRQRDEREAARARERAAATYGTPEPTMPHHHAPRDSDDGGGVTVRRIRVPFLSLVGFFLKAALAAIPAVLLLTALLWAIGHAVQLYYPELLKMQIVIYFPSKS